jgi:hypothetical protein
MSKPYKYPELTSFKKPAMLAQAKRELHLIKRSLKNSKRLKYKEDEYWMRVRSGGSLGKSSEYWRPKLYVCITPRHYWRAIRRLIALSEKTSLKWKYCKKLSTLSRPDKIVVYLKDFSDLKKNLPKIRASLIGLRFHEISHAASTTEMGLEKNKKGIYVGADPVFLREVSWRMYHYIIEASLKLNRSYFKKIEATEGIPVFELFNLSPEHNGPHNFAYSKRQIAFIKKHWRLMV